MPAQVCSQDIGELRRLLTRKLQLHGYSACRDAVLLLEDHYSSNLASNKYESIEDFISKLHRTILFETDDGTSVISPDLAFTVVQKLCNQHQKQTQASGPDGGQRLGREVDGQQGAENDLDLVNGEHAETHEQQQPPTSESLTVRVKNVDCTEQQQVFGKTANNTVTNQQSDKDFKVHYQFLFKRLTSLPIFKQEHFQLTKLSTLTGSRDPSIRCICFGLFVKDISKIDGYTLIDDTGRVPVRLTHDTTFRNRLAYANCLVLIEGIYVNPDDVLFAANIGLAPILLDPIQDKQLACKDEKMIIILKEIYMDDDDICKAVDLLFTGYNSLAEPPLLFILIGDFTRHPCRPSELKMYTKKLLRSIRSCDNLKQSHFVFIPGPRDKCQSVDGELQENKSMPKAPLTKEQITVQTLSMAGFDNYHLATNPTHIHIGDRRISVVSHSYFKELKKHLLHDLSDRDEELFETAKQIILSNAHLSAGISRVHTNPMNLWHRPDLLILADTEAFGKRFDYSSSKSADTSFLTLPSFSRQYNQFKVYYLKSGDIDDSEVSPEALVETIDDEIQVVPGTSSGGQYVESD